MTKKRIFIVNDASLLNTGYGIYGKEILTRLHNSGKFEVAELGCYVEKSHPGIKNIPWKFYPNNVGYSDPRINEYKSNNLNQFGLWRFNRCIADFKPHIVFDVRDYWMFAYQENSPYRKYFNWVIMPATDSAPPKLEWLYTFANADVVMPYTEWAKQTLSNACGNNINLFPKIANAGINSNEFYPVENKKELKIKYFGKDISIVGTVMRNQRRKLLPDLMISYKKYLEYLKLSNKDDLYEKSYLYLHTSYPEDAGWDIPALLLEYGLCDKTYFTYHCRNCNNFFPSKFQMGTTTCQHCNNRSACVASPINGVNTKQLNEIYNLFDIFFQYAICEGFGMPQIEAAACGIPIASVDYSAMTEIVENLKGYKIPVDRVFRELETNADRVYPDNNIASKIMFDFFQLSEDSKQQISTKTRQQCISTYEWDNVYKVWEECFDSIDINSKLSWNTPIQQTTNVDLKVPPNLPPDSLVEYVCNNIINEPSLVNSSYIQSLIRDANSGLVARNGAISTITLQNIVENLENLLNNKIICENIRTNPQSIKKEDFI